MAAARKSSDQSTSNAALGLAVWNASGLPPAFTTGVGKILINLCLEFERMENVRPQLLLPRTDTVNSEADPAKSPLGGIARKRLPLNRVELEFLWRTLRYPAIDRWADDADWIYCPRELWVPPGRLRYAITVHDVYQFEPEVWTGSWRMRLQRKLVWQRAMDRADLVFAVSEFTRTRILALFRIDPEKVLVTPNAVDPIFRQPREPGRRDLPAGFSDTPFVLHVGGLTKKKGAPEIIALARELERRKSTLRILSIGPVEPEFEAAATSKALTVLGRGISPEAIRWITEEARVAILPSRYEGFGIPVLEAMSVGVPVVASCHASLPEIAGSGGLVVDPTLTGEFADLIETLDTDPGKRSEAISHGLHRASQFSWTNTARGIREAMSGHA